MLYILLLLSQTMGCSANSIKGVDLLGEISPVPIQRIIVIDTIVQLHPEYDAETGSRMVVAYSPSQCVFTFVVEEQNESKVLGLAIVTLTDINLDTLQFDDRAIEDTNRFNQNSRGGLHAMSLIENNLAMLFDSSVIVYRIHGKDAIAHNEYRVPAGYGKLDWIDSDHMVLHPVGYHHPLSLRCHEDLYILDVRSGGISSVTLPDTEAAVFRLFAPNRFVSAAFGSLWYLRPTDGSLFRWSESNQWVCAWQGNYTVDSELLRLTRSSASHEVRSYNKKALIDSIDLSVNSGRSSYATGVEFDEQCSVAYVVEYRGEDSLGIRRPALVRAVQLSGAEARLVALYEDRPRSSGMICSRNTYPVQIGGLNSSLKEGFMYKIGHRAPMGIAYQEGASLQEIARAELEYSLNQGARITLTRYRYNQPCLK